MSCWQSLAFLGLKKLIAVFIFTWCACLGKYSFCKDASSIGLRSRYSTSPSLLEFLLCPFIVTLPILVIGNHWPVFYLYGFAYSKLSYLESASIKHLNLAFNRHSAFEVHSRGYISFFLLMTNNPLYGCTSLSTPQVKKLWGCFHYWAIMKNAVVNIHMQVFLWMKFSFHLSKYLGVKLLIVG